jgi:Ca-activated chloride channel family protein
MGFAWPSALLSLLAVPVLLAGYLWALRRRRRQAVPYSSVALLKLARPARSAWRRHVPFALVLAVLASLGLAAARPQVHADVPVSAASVLIALDVSGSMCATDVDPNRLSAAQAAVRQFTRDQDSHTRIGLVAFSSFAQVVVQPTTDRKQLSSALDSLTTGRGTAIGAAILKSVDAIAQIDPSVAPAEAATPGGGDGATPDPGATSGTGAGPAPNKDYAPEIIVLLTDGANTQGVAPIQAAQVAAQRGVRVYPIGFGTTSPTSMVCTAAQLGGNSFENRGFGGGGLRGGFTGGGGPLVADEPTLREVATTTGGTYFAATDADQLRDVLKNLPRHVVVQQRDVELSVALAGLAAVLVLLSIGAAIRWSSFPT